MEDKLLILSFKYDSSEALRRIYEKYRLYVLKLIVVLLHDISLAEDDVHDVYIRFVQLADDFKINGSIMVFEG